ncbi:hypothetical protein GKC32_06935 [Lactobacillus curvatus]|nr:hypothetical protein [Latilactobacillus curvatus]MSE24204.1 hypothetical protein [Latilactobacillus curvatus]
MQTKKILTSFVLSTVFLSASIISPLTAAVHAASPIENQTFTPRYVFSETHNFDFTDLDGGGQAGPGSLNKFNLNGQNSNTTNDFNLSVNSTNRATLIKGALVNTTELPVGTCFLTLFNPNISLLNINNLTLVIQYTDGQKEYRKNAFGRISDGSLAAHADLNKPAHIGFQYDGKVADNSLSFTGYSVKVSE